MSAILYNTNSSLIHKYQRSTLTKNKPSKTSPLHQTTSDELTNENKNDVTQLIDPPFETNYEKNSEPYLKQLCLSIYPNNLASEINELDFMIDLQIHAFAALLIKNFIKSWYGLKIPTSDTEFLTNMFHLVQDIIVFLRKSNVDYETLLMDDIPYIIAQHYKALEIILKTESASQPLTQALVYDLYCESTHYKKGYYPEALSSHLQKYFNHQSDLENSFIDTLLNELLLGRVMRNISEPYYLLRGITKAWEKVAQKPKRASQRRIRSILLSLLAWPYLFRTFIDKLKRIYIRMSETNQSARSHRLCFERYIFSLIFIDLLQTNSKKPFIYTVGKTIQYLISYFTILKQFIEYLSHRFIFKNVINKSRVSYSVNTLRQLLFPNDNMLGHSSPIPTGEEYERFKKKSINDLWAALHKKKLNSLFGLSSEDASNFIETISIDKESNILLFYKLLDCILANFNK